MMTIQPIRGQKRVISRHGIFRESHAQYYILDFYLFFRAWARGLIGYTWANTFKLQYTVRCENIALRLIAYCMFYLWLITYDSHPDRTDLYCCKYLNLRNLSSSKSGNAYHKLYLVPQNVYNVNYADWVKHSWPIRWSRILKTTNQVTYTMVILAVKNLCSKRSMELIL